MMIQKANIQLETLTCPSCLQKIQNSLSQLEGIDQESLKVMFNASRVRVNFDSSLLTIGNIEQAIENLGYAVIKSQVKAA